MKDEQEVVDSSARTAADVTMEGPGAAHEAADRTFLLECRLDQLHSALKGARAEGDLARSQLAASAAREASLARGASDMHTELAAAREEVASLHRRLEHSEALRAEAEGRLLESGARDEAAELARLRREVREERRRADASEETLKELRARIEELMATRETLLTRVAEWQSVVRQGDPDAVDLSEFIAALRGDILELEHRSVVAAEREAGLREQLARAGVAAKPSDEPADEELVAPTRDERPTLVAADADSGATTATDTAAPGEDLAAALAEAGGPDRLLEQLRVLGKRREESAFYAIRRWATATEPRVRAAAFEALGRHLEDDPERLEPHLRWGLADADPRVRRRVVLAAATARGLAIRPLLEPLRLDPDPQVRRVIHEVLRRASSEAAAPATDEAPLAATGGSR